MYDDHAFIQAVRENPHDVSRRLIYADWLEEQGEPQGELIRVQCEMAALSGGERWRALAEREAELLDRYAEEWLRPLRELGAIGVSRTCFHGGLIEKVKIQADDFLRNGEELCRLAPALHCLELRNANESFGQLAREHLPTQITRLELPANRLDESALPPFEASPWREQLTALDLRFNALADEGVQRLCSWDWPRLMELSLSQNRIGPVGAAALARWPDLGHVTRLNLSGNRLSDEGAAALAESPYVGQFEELDLASNQIGDRGAQALAQGEHFNSLRRLSVRANRIASDTLDALRRSRRLPKLTDFDARSNVVYRH